MAEGKLWEKILRDSTQKIRYEDSNLILVGTCHTGSNAAGIQNLISTLQKGPGSLGKSNTSVIETQQVDAVAPLHYSYLNVKFIEDTQSEKIAKMNVWAMEDINMQSLLEIALKPSILKNLVFGIVLDFAAPWRFMEDLRVWMECWTEKLGKVLSTLSLGEQDELINKNLTTLRNYRDPDAPVSEASQEAAPLPEGVLSINFGVPVVVICNKAELCWGVDKNRESAEKLLDYITRTLREWSLPYGGSTIFTSTTDNINIDILYEYLVHRLYGFKFRHHAQVLDRGAMFIPAGWDSPNLISELEYIGMRDKPYEEVFVRPKAKAADKEEIPYETDQDFLQEMRSRIQGMSRVPKRDRDLKKLEMPNPGGEVVEVPTDNAPRNQSTLEKFYKHLLEKGSKDTA